MGDSVGEIGGTLDDFFEWAETTMTIEEKAYIRVMAVLTGTENPFS
jgi:hypothetical protein